jgi:hypothetical protein
MLAYIVILALIKLAPESLHLQVVIFAMLAHTRQVLDAQMQNIARCAIRVLFRVVWVCQQIPLASFAKKVHIRLAWGLPPQHSALCARQVNTTQEQDQQPFQTVFFVQQGHTSRGLVSVHLRNALYVMQEAF